MIDFLQALKQHITGNTGPEEERRASICSGCDLKEIRSYARILHSKMEDINGYVCTECECPLATKIFAQEPENICKKWKR